MRRWSIIAVLLCCSAFAAAQATSSAETLASSDLVAWSYMQQPQAPEQGQTRQQPTPDPQPETQPAPSPSAQPSSPPDSSHASSQPQQSPTAQSFTGTVMKDTDSYTLKVSESTSYKLDNQQQAQQYEGKRVRVTGTLDSSVNLIHVDSIEPMS